MDKKLKLFYRISIWMLSIFVLSNILVKAIIWPFALKEAKDNYRYPIFLRKHIYIQKFTTKAKQNLFNKVDYLLTPAFTMLFAIIAVKLAKTPEIFKEKD